ncbi:MAG TPA: hypothetical protein VES97_07970 [Solirubrobacteraceae bacterium]|nr:hypothetical protein [Solirubrobacteraceae bacterium]
MRRLLAPVCLPLLAVALTACGSTVSTSSFKGEQHEVAQTIANLQADATAGEDKKICANDLAKSLVARLGGSKGCESAIKNQLAEVDSMELKVQSIKLAPGAGASAQVKGIYEGKTRPGTLSLVKEGGRWRISSLG